MTGQRSAQPVLAVLALLFVLSGAAGLFYEAAWGRYLSLFVGHDAYAQVLTLVIFLGGMGLGALFVSRRSASLTNPLLAYALVELIIGIYGLAFHDLIYGPITEWAYRSLFPALGSGTLVTLTKWALAGLLILPPSILLGATFPLMSAGAIRRAEDAPGRTLSLLYFANSLGGAVGVLVAGFILFAAVGLPGTLTSAAILNLTVAVGTILVSKWRPSEDAAPSARLPDAPGSTSDPTISTPLARLLLVLASGTAVASFIYEIAWLRMLSMVIGSSTHSFELMLSAFILGLALGALWIRRRADAVADPLRTLITVQIVMGTLALLTVPIYLESFRWMAALLSGVSRTESGYVIFVVLRYLVCLAVMLPATFCAGMTLPLMTKRLMTAGAGEQAIGAIYAANTIGSILGAALAGLVLLPAVGLKGTLMIGGLVDIGLGLIAIRALHPAAIRASRPALIALGTAAVAALIVAMVTRWDQRLFASGVFRTGEITSLDERDILFHADGRTATVHAARVKAGGYVTLSTNGKPDGSLSPAWFDRCDPTVARRGFSGDDGTQINLALFTLAYAPQARNGAVIGLGTGMSSHVLLASPALTSLKTIEIEPAMVAGARVFLPANRRVFDDPRSEIVLADAKSYFAATNTQYDLVLSEPSNPWVSGVSGLFTTEFYRQVKRYLAPGAVFGQWLHTYELSDELVGSVLAALHENFSDYHLHAVTGGDILVVATAEGALPRPNWAVTRLPAVQEDLCRFLPMSEPALDRTLVLDRKGIAPLLDRAIQANSDFYPVLDLGAERTRFEQLLATGVASLGTGSVSYLADTALAPRGFDTATVNLLGASPTVRGMVIAARMRSSAPDSGWTDPLATNERHLLGLWRLQTGMNMPAGNWQRWTQDFWTLHRAFAAGLATIDTVFYVSGARYLTSTGGPEGARAAVALGQALAARDLPAGAASVDVLLRDLAKGTPWIPADDLLDASVRVLLAANRPADAAFAFQALQPKSTRGATDLRVLLLSTYITATQGGRP